MNRDIFLKLLEQRQFKAVRSILDVMNEEIGRASCRERV